MFCVIILLFTLTLNEIYATESEYPKWPVTCSFARYVGKYPLSGHYTSSYEIDEPECERRCGEDPRCGMFEWERALGTCYRHQHSLRMWRDAGLRVGDVMSSHGYSNTGSKECNEQVAPRGECQNYVHKRGRLPSSGRITKVFSRKGSLTSDVCKHLCDFYSECRSVAYYRNSEMRCELFTNKTSDGSRMCGYYLGGPCGTYERECEPTTPSPPPTPDCPTDISEFQYHGTTSCLPVGESQELCESINGCCYFQVLSIGFCLRPVSD